MQRCHPFARARLSDEDLSVDFAQETMPEDRVAVIVTSPLTCDEQWTPFVRGRVHVFTDGSLQSVAGKAT